MANTDMMPMIPASVGDFELFLSSEIDQEIPALQLLIDLAVRNLDTPDRWTHLHQAAQKMDRLAELAFAYERISRDGRLREVNPTIQAAIFTHAANFFLDHLGDPEGAQDYLKLALIAVPNFDTALQKSKALLFRKQDSVKLCEQFVAAAQATTNMRDRIYYLEQAVELCEGVGGETDRVSRIYDLILASDPHHVIARQVLEDKFSRTRNVNDLIQLYESLLANSADMPLEEEKRLRDKLVEVYTSRGNHLERALEHLSALLERDPTHAVAKRTVEQMLSNRVYAAEAAYILERVYEQHENHSEHVRMLHILAEHATGDEKLRIQRKLIVVLMDALGDFPNAYALCDYLLRATPFDADLRARYIYLSRVLQNTDHAVRTLAQIATSIDDIASVDIYADTGELALECQDIATARWAFEQGMRWKSVIADSPVYLRLIRGLSQVDAITRNYPQLVLWLEQLAELEPDQDARITAVETAAKLYQNELNDDLHAIGSWQKLLGTNLEKIALVSLEKLYRKTASREELANVLERIALRDRAANDAKAHLFEAAEIRSSLRDRKKAILTWRNYIQHFGPEPRALKQLTLILEHDRQWEELHEVLELHVSVASESDRAPIWIRIARVRAEKLNNVLQAIDALEHALSLDPTSTPARVMLQTFFDTSQDVDIRYNAARCLEPLLRREEPSKKLIETCIALAEKSNESLKFFYLEDASRIAEEHLHDRSLSLELLGKSLQFAAHGSSGRIVGLVTRIEEFSELTFHQQKQAIYTNALGTGNIVDHGLAYIAQAAAKLLLTNGDTDGALSLFQKVFEFDSSKVDVLLQLDSILATQPARNQERVLILEKALPTIKEDQTRQQIFHSLFSIWKSENQIQRIVEMGELAISEGLKYRKIVDSIIQYFIETNNLNLANDLLHRFILNIADNEDRVEILFQIAHIKENLGKIDEANEVYQQILEMAPQHEQAIVHIAKNFERIGNIEHATDFLEKQDVNQASFEIRLTYIELLNKRGHYARAVDVLEQWVLSDKSDERLLKLLQTALDWPSERDRVARILERFAEPGRDELSPTVVRGLAELAARRSFEDLDSFYIKYRPTHEYAEQIALVAVERYPERDESWVWLETCAIQQNRMDAVIIKYRSMIDNGTYLPSSTLNHIAQRWINFIDEWYDEPSMITDALLRIMDALNSAEWAFERLKVQYSNHRQFERLIDLYDRRLEHSHQPAERLIILEDLLESLYVIASISPRIVEHLLELQTLSENERHFRRLEKFYEKNKRDDLLIRLWERRSMLGDAEASLRWNVKVANYALDRLHDYEKALEKIETILQTDTAIAIQLAEHLLDATPISTTPDSVRHQCAQLLAHHYRTVGSANDLARVLDVCLEASLGEQERIKILQEISDIYSKIEITDDIAFHHGCALFRLTPHDQEHRDRLIRLATRRELQEKLCQTFVAAANELRDSQIASHILVCAGDILDKSLGNTDEAIAQYRVALGLIEHHLEDEIRILSRLETLFAKTNRPAERSDVLHRLITITPNSSDQIELIEKFITASIAAEYFTRAIEGYELLLQKATPDFINKNPSHPDDKEPDHPDDTSPCHPDDAVGRIAILRTALDELIILLEREKQWEKLVHRLHERSALGDATESKSDLVRAATILENALHQNKSAISVWMDIRNRFGLDPSESLTSIRLLEENNQWDDLIHILKEQIQNAQHNEFISDLNYRIGNIYSEKLNDSLVSAQYFLNAAKCNHTESCLKLWSLFQLLDQTSGKESLYEIAQTIAPVVFEISTSEMLAMTEALSQLSSNAEERASLWSNAAKRCATHNNETALTCYWKSYEEIPRDDVLCDIVNIVHQIDSWPWLMDRLPQLHLSGDLGSSIWLTAAQWSLLQNKKEDTEQYILNAISCSPNNLQAHVLLVDLRRDRRDQSCAEALVAYAKWVPDPWSLRLEAITIVQETNQSIPHEWALDFVNDALVRKTTHEELRDLVVEKSIQQLCKTSFSTKDVLQYIASAQNMPESFQKMVLQSAIAVQPSDPLYEALLQYNISDENVLNEWIHFHDKDKKYDALRSFLEDRTLHDANQNENILYSFALGRICEAQSALDEAIGWYQNNCTRTIYHPASSTRLFEIFTQLERSSDLIELLETKAYSLKSTVVEDAIQCWMDAAEIAEHLGNIERAISNWNCVLEIKPDNGNIRFVVATQLKNCNRISEAIACLEEGARNHPQTLNSDYLELLAHLYGQVNRHNDEERCLEAAWTSFHSITSAEQLQVLYEHTQQWAKLARHWISRAHSSHEERKLFLTKAASVYMGPCADPNSAIGVLQELVEIHPVDPAIELMYCRALRAIGNSDASAQRIVQWMNHLETRKPKYRADFHVELASIYAQSEQKEAAIRELELAQRIDSTNTRMLVDIATIYLNMSDTVHAESVLKSALLLRSSSTDVLQRVYVLTLLARIAELHQEDDHMQDYIDDAFELLCNGNTAQREAFIGSLNASRLSNAELRLTEKLLEAFPNDTSIKNQLRLEQIQSQYSNNPERIAQELSQWLENEFHPRALELLATTQINQGAYFECIDMIQKWIEHYSPAELSQKQSIQQILAECYEATEQFDHAWNTLYALCGSKSREERSSILMKMIRIAERAENDAQLRETLKQALTHEPTQDLIDSWIRLSSKESDLSARCDQYLYISAIAPGAVTEPLWNELAEAYQANDNIDNANFIAEQALAQHCTGSWISLIRGDYHKHHQQFTAAITEYRRALSSGDSAQKAQAVSQLETLRLMPNLDPETKRIACVDLIRWYLDLEDFEHGIFAIHDALQEYPHDRQLLDWLAQAYEKTCDFENAFKTYRALLEKYAEPEDKENDATIVIGGDAFSNAVLRYVAVAEKVGKLREVRSALEIAYRADPNVKLRNALKTLYQQTGAKKEYAKLLLDEANREPNSDIQLGLWLNAAKILIDLGGEVAQSLAILEKAKELQPTSLEVLSLMVDIEMLRGRYDVARELIQEALSGNKGRRSKAVSNLYQALARIERIASNKTAALKALVRAFENDSQNADLAIELGKFAHQQGDTDTASRVYRAITLMRSKSNEATEGISSADRAVAYYELANISLQQGDRRKARLMVEKAIGEDASLVAAQHLLEELRAH